TFANTRSFINTPAVGVDGTIYAGTQEGYLHALRPDGTLLWAFNSGDGYLKTPVIGANGAIFFAGGNFHAVNPDGQRLWTIPTALGADSGPSFISPQGLIYAQADYTYFVLNAASGVAQKSALPVASDNMRTHVARDANGSLYLYVLN